MTGSHARHAAAAGNPKRYQSIGIRARRPSARRYPEGMVSGDPILLLYRTNIRFLLLS